MEAVLLAGGKSKRMGKDKLALSQNGKTVLTCACERFMKVFETVAISVDSPDRYPEIPLAHIVDVYKNCGPLGGLHAALLHSKEDGVFLCAADLPFSSPELALKLISMSDGFDICVTTDKDGKFEPLFAYYRKSVLQTAEKLLQSGAYKMTELYAQSRVRTVTPDELGAFWSEQAFENMNYPGDYARLLNF